MNLDNHQTLIQCDFDGTVTVEDLSFLLLDIYARGDWRQPFEEYVNGRMTVGRFNSVAFAMINEDRATLLETCREHMKLRPGFEKFVKSCRDVGQRLVIVSNGLDFYIEAVLQDAGLDGLEFHAAETVFANGGLKVRYLGPDGEEVDQAFKEAYVNLFRSQGYRMVYIGNGSSDFPPAKMCDHIFATESLLDQCRKNNIEHTPFEDFEQVTVGLEKLT